MPLKKEVSEKEKRRRRLYARKQRERDVVAFVCKRVARKIVDYHFEYEPEHIKRLLWLYITIKEMNIMSRRLERNEVAMKDLRQILKQSLEK